MKTFWATGTAKANLNELTSGNLLTGMALGRGIALIDPEGTILHTQVYDVDTFLAMQSVKRLMDNDFFFAGGYHKDSCTVSGTLTIPHTYPVIGRMDSMGVISAAHYYRLDQVGCWALAGDLEVMNDNGVVTWGLGGTGIQWSFFALKASSIGDVIWAKHVVSHGGFQFIKELPSGDLLAGINMDTAGVAVARLDAAGNFIWCRSYIRPRGMIHDCIIESDDAYVITGFTDSLSSTNLFEPLPPNYDPKLFLMKLNGVGEVQWCRGFDSPTNPWHVHTGTRLTKSLDGNYVLLSNLGEAGSSFWYRPFLLKADQNGDTLWTRSIGAFGYSYQTQSLLAYSDGGFIFNGRIWGDLPNGQANWAFLYKTDSLGHLPCSEQPHQIQVLDLFPNDSSFTLISVDGATALPAFVQDTVYDPIVMYDGCTFTTGIPTTGDRSRTKPRIRPNPNTGQFTVEFADPLVAQSYYSVYDAMGKLLYQRPLPTGAKLEEVDLGRFGSGTYAIKFTSPAGVSYEKVVVE